MTFRPGDHVFVDESKARGYVLAAVAVPRHEVGKVEQALRSMRHGRRSSIHFIDEGNRRDLLLRQFTALRLRATVYVMRGASDRVARPALIRALVGELVDAGAHALTLERDESVEQADRRAIHGELERLQRLRRLAYTHRDRRESPILWVADAIAWCHHRGGVWPAKVGEMVTDVQHLEAP